MMNAGEKTYLHRRHFVVEIFPLDNIDPFILHSYSMVADVLIWFNFNPSMDM